MKDNFLLKNLIAHRGVFDNNKIPENSLRSFKEAIKGGYIIEFDIHLTKDNEIIVFHDAFLDRMTNKKGYVKDYSLKELTSIKLLNTNYHIPSLDEVLDLINGKVPILIELKHDINSFKLPRLLLKKLETYSGEVAIQSFDPFLISYFRFHKNPYLRGLLINQYRFLPFKIFISKPDFLSVNKKLYKNVKKYQNKRLILCWTMKSKDDVLKYKDKYDNLICNIKDCM